MSEESLLSELCTICHINTPKYRCPRCFVRTCSLPCTRKHKNWSQCTGVRDPAAFLPRPQLENEASFDRDFNFITSIERGLERAEREAENRGIPLEHEYMIATSQKDKVAKKRKRGPFSQGQNQNERNATTTRLAKGELGFIRAAEAAGVKLLRAPRGLTRNKMNHSKVHPKHKCLNWSVEWIVPSTKQSIVRPCLETTPLGEAYDRVFPAPKNKDTDTTPEKSIEQLQLSTPEDTSGNDQMMDAHRGIYLYLHRHLSATKHTVLVPLRPTATLRDILCGRNVVEFPTIYVLNRPLETKAEGSDTSLEEGRYMLEEVYLRDHPDEVEAEENEQSEDEEEGGEEDYTSSEGSSSDETSDEGDDEDEDEDNNEVDVDVEEEIDMVNKDGSKHRHAEEAIEDVDEMIVQHQNQDEQTNKNETPSLG